MKSPSESPAPPTGTQSIHPFAGLNLSFERLSMASMNESVEASACDKRRPMKKVARSSKNPSADDFCSSPAPDILSNFEKPLSFLPGCLSKTFDNSKSRTKSACKPVHPYINEVRLWVLFAPSTQAVLGNFGDGASPRINGSRPKLCSCK